MAVAYYLRYDIVGLSMGQEFVLTQGYVGDSTMTLQRTAQMFLSNREAVVSLFLAYALTETNVLRHRVYFLSGDPLSRFSYSVELGRPGLFGDDPIMPQLCVKIEKRGTADFERVMRSRLHVPSVGQLAVTDGGLTVSSTQMYDLLPQFLTGLITPWTYLALDGFGGLADEARFDAAVIAKRPAPLPATGFRYQFQRNSGWASLRLATLRSRSPGRGR